MAFFTAASKADFQHQLQAALAQHISEQALPQVALFAEQFFGIISLDELTQRRLSDLAGCTLSAWRLLERFDDRLAGILDGGHRVGNQERTEGRTANDDEFPRLHQDVQVSTHRHEAAEHTAQRHDESDQNAHSRSFRTFKATYRHR